MKLHLPKLLLTAVLTAIGATASHADDSSTSYTLGDVMYVGDSITHGYYEASYRWALHKIMVDNGVKYNEVGYGTNNTGGDKAGDAYRGVTFKNIHSATSGIRAWQVAGKTSKTATEYTKDPINGILNTTSASTFVLLLGTNDLLSDNNQLTNDALATVTNNLLGTDRKSGDIGHIVDAMYESNPNATLYVSTIPCWTLHQNNDGEEPHAAVATYNESLKTWVANYNTANSKNIKLVDVNHGMLDVAASKPFYGVTSMFRDPGVNGDGLHPNAQGELIIAGNMARAMGISGRTAGAARKAAESFNFHSNGRTVGLGEYSWKNTLSSAGFTAELQGFTFGNGSTDGWNTTDNFSFTMGNGTIAGTLNINEGYIQWGNDILFSENMSALSENIRMAYIAGDSENGIGSGFYVWLGDMLIGEALAGTSSTLSNVKLSYSGASSYTISALAMDSTGAYAPTSDLYYLISAPSATAQGGVTIPVGVTVVTGDTSETNKLFANKGEHTGGVWCRVSSGQYSAWTGAHASGTLDGNVTMIFDDKFQGTGTAFGIVNGKKVTGDVTLQFDAANAVYGSWTNTETDYASVVGSFSGAIDGTFKAVINAGTFQYDILGGSYNGSSVGSTEIYINGGSIGRNVYGGSQNGTVGSTSVTITGGYVQGDVYGGGRGANSGNLINGSTSVTITGGTIGGDIYAGGSGGTIKGNTALTIEGNLPTLHGKLLSAGGSDGTINGNASLTIKNASANNYIASIDKFTGTLSGGANVSGSSTLVFDASQLSGTAFDSVTVEHFDSINLTNGSNIILGATSLDGANGSTISLTGDSHLTVEGNFSSTTGLSITGASGSVTLAGQNNTFGGGISVAAGNTLTLSGDLAFNIEDGDFDISYTYDTSRTTNGLGNVTVKVSGLEHLLTGEGSLNTDAVTKLTVNGSIVDKDALASATSEYTKENAVYYVMDANSSEVVDSRVYDVGGGRKIKLSETINVGNNTYAAGPTPTPYTNEAQGFYIGENGVLCISGATDTFGTISDVFESVHGYGDIILRAPGIRSDNAEVTEVTVDKYIDFHGNLYMSPQGLYSDADNATLFEYGAVKLHLTDGANISTFKSIQVGEYDIIDINGTIERSDTSLGHFNNVNVLGNTSASIYLSGGSNDEILFGGDTAISPYKYGSSDATGGELELHFKKDGTIRIENLKDGENPASFKSSILAVYTAQLDTTDETNATLYIDSFEYTGMIYFYGMQQGTLDAEVNLLNNQVLKSSQYGRATFGPSIESFIIKGVGTYILDEGFGIEVNYGELSQAMSSDNVNRIWQGTVQITAFDGSASGTGKGMDFLYYGNEQSTIDMRGVKTDVVNWNSQGVLAQTTNNAALIESDLILTNIGTEGDASFRYGYEVTGGIAEQTYTGDISGTGDFVVSAGSSMTFNLQGDLSEWKDGAELKVTGGTQAVNFSGKATKVNADIEVADTAKLNLSVGTGSDTAHTTKFTGKVKASSLTTYSGTTAEFAGAETKIGNVNISSRDKKNAAVIKSGMTITDGNTVSGGEASNAELAFDSTEGFLSNAKLTGVSLCALQAGASIKMEGIVANDVYLAGATNFESLDEQTKFVYQGIVKAFDKNYNEVYFESTSFSGMTLDKELTGTITLSVSNDITVSGETAMADVPTNVSILLKGFTVEGLTLGKRMEGMFDPLKISIMDGAQVAALSADTVITVGQLLNYEDYQEVYYVQQADGLLIRMSNIPEPTTATLSLLALTALATRRRRK